MLTVGIILLLVGFLVAVLLPRGREFGIVAAVVGVILIALVYIPQLG
jgi:hypothetical protein